VKITWMPLALDRVNDIVDYIARDRPTAAETWAIGVFDLVEKLLRSPLRGRVVPEVGREEIRELRYGKYRIVYRIDKPETIAILTVRHGGRLLDLSELDK